MQEPSTVANVVAVEHCGPHRETSKRAVVGERDWRAVAERRAEGGHTGLSAARAVVHAGREAAEQRGRVVQAERVVELRQFGAVGAREARAAPVQQARRVAAGESVAVRASERRRRDRRGPVRYWNSRAAHTHVRMSQFPSAHTKCPHMYSYSVHTVYARVLYSYRRRERSSAPHVEHTVPVTEMLVAAEPRALKAEQRKMLASVGFSLVFLSVVVTLIAKSPAGPLVASTSSGWLGAPASATISNMGVTRTHVLVLVIAPLAVIIGSTCSSSHATPDTLTPPVNTHCNRI